MEYNNMEFSNKRDLAIATKNIRRAIKKVYTLYNSYKFWIRIINMDCLYSSFLSVSKN